MNPKPRIRIRTPKVKRIEFDPSSQLNNAIQLVSKQDQIMWSIFGIFCPTNALLLIALFTTGSFPKPNIGIIVSLAGVLLSIVWMIIQRRAIAHFEFYDNIVQRLEETYISTPPNVAISGRTNNILFSESMSGTLRIRPLIESIGFVSAILWLFALIYFAICALVA